MREKIKILWSQALNQFALVLTREYNGNPDHPISITVRSSIVINGKTINVNRFDFKLGWIEGAELNYISWIAQTWVILALDVA